MVDAVSMFKKILYPTDFSDVSKKAIDYIKQLTESGSETVIALHVINQRGMQAIEQYASGTLIEIKQRIMDDAKQQIEVTCQDKQA